MSGFIDRLKSAMLPPLLVVGGAVVIYLGVQEAKTSAAIADHGKQVTAQVVAVHWQEKGVSKREKGFQAEIEFQTEDKREIKTRVSVSKDLGQQMRDSKEQPVLEVKYLPETPETVVLADHKDGSTFMYGAGALLIVVGAGIFVYRRRKAAQPETAENAA